ncbi:hypothetical protein ACOMHN_059072 [Nucella lapillus]
MPAELEVTFPVVGFLLLLLVVWIICRRRRDYQQYEPGAAPPPQVISTTSTESVRTNPAFDIDLAHPDDGAVAHKYPANASPRGASAEAIDLVDVRPIDMLPVPSASSTAGGTSDGSSACSSRSSSRSSSGSRLDEAQPGTPTVRKRAPIATAAAAAAESGDVSSGSSEKQPLAE